jgi:hypothetical protein
MTALVALAFQGSAGRRDSGYREGCGVVRGERGPQLQKCVAVRPHPRCRPGLRPALSRRQRPRHDALAHAGQEKVTIARPLAALAGLIAVGIYR